MKGGKGKINLYYPKNNILYIREYLNGELNGEKKFKNNITISECHYLNGIKIGKGKEYDQRTGKLKFEGEYYYGYRIRGKTYVEEKLEFDGEFLFNERWNGIGFDPLGNTVYELQNGNGNIKIYENGNLIFEGDYLKGKITGKGKQYDRNGNLIYKGEYLNSQWNGKGKE